MQISIQNWLHSANNTLQQVGISSSRLDTELILTHALNKNREFLLAHSEEKISTNTQRQADIWLKRRMQREPLAYIFGEKEFYGRTFTVTPDTLIPRPETETIIELFEKYSLKGRVLDVGTGSGCVGLTLKLESPSINITISDVSSKALGIARKNGRQLNANPVRYVESDLLNHWLSHVKPKKFDVIVSNLPYVDRSWEVSPETASEPELALFADDNGLLLIKKLIEQSKDLLEREGHLILEADPRQHQAIMSYTEDYKLIEQDRFILLLQKVL